MQFTGSVSAVRTALSALYYLPAQDSYGLDTLTVTATDSSLFSVSAVTRIVVDSVNDSPVVRLAEPFVWVPEDTPVVIPNITFSDVDLSADGVLQVVVEVTHGTVNLDLSSLQSNRTHSTIPVQLLQGSAQSSSRLVLIGQVDDLNTLFAQGLEYVPTPHMNLHWGDDNGTGLIAFTVREFSVSSSSVLGETAAALNPFSSARVKVYVTPVNTAPVVNAPVMLSTLEDTPLLLTNITVEDSDWEEVRGTTFQANVSVMFGTLSIDAKLMYQLGLYRNPQTGGTSALTDGALDLLSSTAEVTYNSVLTFSVHHLDDLNLLLSGITYTPPADRNGEDYLQISASDTVPGSTADAAVATVAHCTILLQSVNDAPVISAPAHIVTVEDSIYSVSNVRITDVDFVTNPVPSALLTVSITCAKGEIKLAGKY